METPALDAARQTAAERAAMAAWIDARLAEHGLTRRGRLRARLRPWSTVLRVPTDAGLLYFKATSPYLANDPALTAHLAGRAPDIVLRPLAVDVDRRWMLLEHGGTRLVRYGPDRRLLTWERLLPRYAELQRSLLGDAGELLRLGALDRRGSRLARQVGTLLDEPGLGLSSVDCARLRSLLPTVDALGAEVDRDGIGMSLQHDDLHDGNVVVDGDRPRIFDWGDAAVSHPLATLGTTLPAVAGLNGLPVDGPEIRSLRDAYFEPWLADRSRAELERAARLLLSVYPLMRALTWSAALATLPGGAEHEHRGARAALLGEFLARSG